MGSGGGGNHGVLGRQAEIRHIENVQAGRERERSNVTDQFRRRGRSQ